MSESVAASRLVRLSTSVLHASVPAGPPNKPCQRDTLSCVRLLTASVISSAQAPTSSGGPSNVTTRWKMIMVCVPSRTGWIRSRRDHPPAVDGQRAPQPSKGQVLPADPCVLSGSGNAPWSACVRRPIEQRQLGRIGRLEDVQPLVEVGSTDRVAV